MCAKKRPVKQEPKVEVIERWQSTEPQMPQPSKILIFLMVLAIFLPILGLIIESQLSSHAMPFVILSKGGADAVPGYGLASVRSGANSELIYVNSNIYDSLATNASYSLDCWYSLNGWIYCESLNG